MRRHGGGPHYGWPPHGRLRPSFYFNGLILFLAFLTLGLGLWSLHRPVADSTLSAPPPSENPYSINKTSILSDFDGDGQPDLATSRVEASHYRIDIELSAQHQRMSFTVLSSQPRIGLIARDLDGDHDYDLIIVSDTFPSFVGVWLNDGHGHFEPSIPGPFWGEARSAYCQNTTHETGAVLCHNPRLSFDRSPVGVLRRDLKPTDSIPAIKSQAPFLQILASNIHPRSPPISTYL